MTGVLELFKNTKDIHQASVDTTHQVYWDPTWASFMTRTFANCQMSDMSELQTNHRRVLDLSLIFRELQSNFTKTFSSQNKLD
jgi:hypothetical protein